MVASRVAAAVDMHDGARQGSIRPPLVCVRIPPYLSSTSCTGRTPLRSHRMGEVTGYKSRLMHVLPCHSALPMS